MAHQNLIDLQNENKQKNINQINSLNMIIETTDQDIANSLASITAMEEQKVSYGTLITGIEAENTLIDEIIAILSE